MTRCDNCFELAAYTCADPGVNPVNYCVKCLPVWLHDRANAGHFPLVTPVAEKAPVVEEEVPTEEDPTPAPKKKSTKSA